MQLKSSYLLIWCKERLKNLCNPALSRLVGLRHFLAPKGAENLSGQGTVYGKGGKTRQITLPPVLAQSLQEFRGNASASSPVFASARGRALAPAHIHRLVKRAAIRAELPQAEKVSPHWLRHAHATHALENHAPIALVQATLGHVSLETTSKYLHIRPSQSSGDFL